MLCQNFSSCLGILQRMAVCTIFGISLCFSVELWSQIPPSKSSTPPASSPIPSPSLNRTKPLFQRPPQKSPRLPPGPPPSMAPHEHPEPYITKGDARQIFSLLENQLNAIQHQDFKSAYYNYTSEGFKKATSLDEFIFFVTGYPVFTNNKNSMFSHLSLKNNIANLQGTLTATTGQILNVEYYFIQEDGMWKIIGIQVFPIQETPKSRLSPLQKTTEKPLEQPIQEIVPMAKEPPFKIERHYDFQGDIH